MDAVEAMFKEYDTLRQEVLQSITHRTQIISFGFGGIATVVSASLISSLKDEDPHVIGVIFSILIPVASVVFLYLWLAELARMFRASDHLAELEDRINRRLPLRALTWESKLIERNKRYSFHLVVVFLFAAVALFSPFLGLVISDLGISDWLAWAPGAVISFGVGLHVGMWTEDLRQGRDRAAKSSTAASVST